MHFPHASVFLISFGFQHYWFVLWRGGGERRKVMLTGVVKSTLPPGFGLVYGGGGGWALNEGLEWRAMNAGGHEPVGPEFDPR